MQNKVHNILQRSFFILFFLHFGQYLTTCALQVARLEDSEEELICFETWIQIIQDVITEYGDAAADEMLCSLASQA